MSHWIEELRADSPSLEQLLVACQAGPIPMPGKCPACGAVAAHIYFDKREHPQLGSRLGSYWVWCSSCRRYTHGSIHAPVWWENLEAVKREALESSPVYLADLSAEIDEHWQHLMRAQDEG